MGDAVDGLKWALEIIDGKTYFDDGEHKEYIKKIKDAIQEAIDYNSDEEKEKFMGHHVPYEAKLCVYCDSSLEYCGKNNEGGKIWHCNKCDKRMSDFDLYLRQHSTEL